MWQCGLHPGAKLEGTVVCSNGRQFPLGVTGQAEKEIHPGFDTFLYLNLHKYEGLK